jgi:hypothetical protein
MSTTVNQSINELPLVQEVVAGDKFIIDNGEQTRRVDFVDFIIGLDNVTFAQTISDNSTNIFELSATVTDLITTPHPQAIYYMNSNAVATTIASANQYYKILGTTSPGDVMNMFTHSNNRVTYIGTVSGIYHIAVDTSITSGNNNVITLRIARNNITRPSSSVQGTTSSNGILAMPMHDLLYVYPGDYFEVFVTNTVTTSVTVTYLNFIITQ